MKTYSRDNLTHAVKAVDFIGTPINQSLCSDNIESSMYLFDISDCDLGDETLEITCPECIAKLASIPTLNEDSKVAVYETRIDKIKALWNNLKQKYPIDRYDTIWMEELLNFE